MSSYPNQLTPLPGPHFYQVQVVSAVQQPSTYTLVPLKTLNFPAPSLNRSPQHASLTSSSSPSPSPTPTSAAGESISSLASSPPVPRAQLQQRQDQAAMALFSHPQINPTLLAAYAPVPPTSSAAKSVPQLKAPLTHTRSSSHLTRAQSTSFSETTKRPHIDFKPFIHERATLNPTQHAILERVFLTTTQNPDGQHRIKLSSETGLNPKKIQIWFQNRRAKERRETAQGKPPPPLPPLADQAVTAEVEEVDDQMELEKEGEVEEVEEDQEASQEVVKTNQEPVNSTPTPLIDSSSIMETHRQQDEKLAESSNSAEPARLTSSLTAEAT